MSDFRIIITGGRKRESSSDYKILDNDIWVLDHAGSFTGNPVIIQGGCPTGIDLLARKIAEEHSIHLETFPANWKKFGRAAGPIRNQAMAYAGADLCLAFPSADKSTGTWNMIRRAVHSDIETCIYPEEEA